MFRCLILTLLVAGGVASVAAQGGSACHAKLTSEVQVPVPGRAFSVLPTEDGCWVFVSAHPRADGKGGGLSIIDLRHGSPKLARTINNPYPQARYMRMALTHDGRFLMLGAIGHIWVYDVRKLIAKDTDSPAGEYMGNGMFPSSFTDFAITSDDRTMFVSDHVNQSITAIDLAQTRAANFQKFAVLGTIPVGFGSGSLVLSKDGRRLYALTQIADDTSPWQKMCRAPGAPATAPPNHRTGAVQVIDTAKAITDPTRSVLTTTAAGCDPVRLILDKNDKRAYVSSRSDDKVLVFDVGRLTSDPAQALLASVPTRTGPVGLALVDGERALAVANAVRFSGGKKDIEGVSIIDTASIDSQPKISETIPSPGPVDIALLPRSDILAIANYESEQVTFLPLRDRPRQ